MKTWDLARERPIFCPATQAQLGDTLGLTSAHVNRTVRMLSNLDLATVSKWKVTVQDWDALGQ